MTVTASGVPGESRGAGRPIPVILVVEDQPQLLRALQINLRARQYEVLTAATGQDALAVAASKRNCWPGSAPRCAVTSRPPSRRRP